MNWLCFSTLLFATCMVSCHQDGDQIKTESLAECSCPDRDSTTTTPYANIRGALLGSRFASFDELKSVLQIVYDSTGPGHYRVTVRHCSGGREAVAILETGVSQGDFAKARYSGTIWDKLIFLYRSPHTIQKRKELEKSYTLSRWRPEWFGEGDVAFFDIAKLTSQNINTPDWAFINSRDSTEKGYLNSFNHLTAQAFITSCFSEEMADFIADSHERYRHPELITGCFTEEQVANLDEGPVDNYVDMINNEWGQELGKQLKVKYNINQFTKWTPELLSNYLNDLQAYYSWAFQIGFRPFRSDDEAVIRFSHKLNVVMNGYLNYQQTITE